MNQKPGYTGTWNPQVYERFAAYRARPAGDFIPRLKFEVAGDIYDLGCGPGALTAQLRKRWPERRVVGVDSSLEMLADARERFADVAEWQQGDIATWEPPRPAALVFSNAALHWVPDHARLFPRLMRQVAPGGLLAVQMPMTGHGKYHHCLRTVQMSPRWKARLGDVRVFDDVLPTGVYYDMLAPLASEVDVWETTYCHVLTGAHPVTEWVKGTALVPLLTALDESEKAAFVADYNAAADAAYPRQADGSVLFDMRRLFLVARRK